MCSLTSLSASQCNPFGRINGEKTGSGCNVIQLSPCNLPGRAEENRESSLESRCRGQDASRSPVEYESAALLP